MSINSIQYSKVGLGSNYPKIDSAPAGSSTEEKKADPKKIALTLGAFAAVGAAVVYAVKKHQKPDLSTAGEKIVERLKPGLQKFEDGSYINVDKTGIKRFERLADGTKQWYDKEGNLLAQTKDDFQKLFNKDGKELLSVYGDFYENSLFRTFDPSGKLSFEVINGDTSYPVMKLIKNGQEIIVTSNGEGVDTVITSLGAKTLDRKTFSELFNNHELDKTLEGLFDPDDVHCNVPKELEMIYNAFERMKDFIFDSLNKTTH